MRSAWTVLWLVAVVHLAATAVPGPTTLVVIRSALNRSFKGGLAAASGVMTGDVIWAAAAMIGMTVVIDRLGWLHTALSVGGGAYLIYLGISTWRDARLPEHPPDEEDTDGWKCMRRGLLTNLTNPKSMVFFASIFAAILPASASPGLRLAAIGIVAVNALWWHAALSVLFSRRQAKDLYRRAKPWTDRVSGGVLTVLGALLFNEAR